MTQRLPPPPPPSPPHANGSGKAFGPAAPPPTAMDIRLDRPRRLWGLAGYVALTLAVAGLLVWMFVQFTASMRIALGLVAFLLAYMFFMATLAGQDADRKE